MTREVAFGSEVRERELEKTQTPRENDDEVARGMGERSKKGVSGGPASETGPASVK